MNSDKITQVFLILVNAGVLLSVILLIFELRQNQEIAIAQTRNDISRQAMERDMYLSSSEISSVIVKAENGEELDAVEMFQFDRAYSVLFQVFENIVYQYEAGLYSDDEFLVVEERLESLRPTMLDYYIKNASGYSASFQRTMTRIYDLE